MTTWIKEIYIHCSKWMKASPKDLSSNPVYHVVEYLRNCFRCMYDMVIDAYASLIFMSIFKLI